jgi:hypothetical protein
MAAHRGDPQPSETVSRRHSLVRTGLDELLKSLRALFVRQNFLFNVSSMIKSCDHIVIGCHDRKISDEGMRSCFRIPGYDNSALAYFPTGS